MPKSIKQKHKLPPFVAKLTMAGEEATIDVTGVIGWDTKATTFTDLVAQAKKAGCQKLTVRINSVGGYCYDGLAMGDCLKNCGMETVGVVVGTAQSMASYLLQCCDKRVAHKHATLMFHQPTAGVFGTVDEIADEAAYLCRMRDDMFETMGQRCGTSGATLSAEHMTKKMYNADDAKAKGFIDAIMGEEEEGTPPETTPLPSPAEDATLCGLMTYEAACTMAAMLGEEAEEEGEEEEKKKTPPPPADKKDGQPEPPPPSEPEKGKQGEEREEEEEEGEKPANAAEPPLTREVVAEMIAQARAEEAAKMGVPADQLPANTADETAGSPKPTQPTMEELDAMHPLRRNMILSGNPELARKYLAN